jgi:hypothetical protein
MFINDTTNEKFPKTLEIRNNTGGMIWQIYHVNNLKEAQILSRNSYKNGFMESTLKDYYKIDETFPNWRNECSKELKEVLT